MRRMRSRIHGTLGTRHAAMTHTANPRPQNKQSTCTSSPRVITLGRRAPVETLISACQSGCLRRTRSLRRRRRRAFDATLHDVSQVRPAHKGEAVAPDSGRLCPRRRRPHPLRARPHLPTSKSVRADALFVPAFLPLYPPSTQRFLPPVCALALIPHLMFITDCFGCRLGRVTKSSSAL